MKKQTKRWLIVATVLVVFGFTLFVGVMSNFKWDFTKLSTVKYENNTYQVKEEFSGIMIKTNTADIEFEPSDDGICKVVCCEMENVKHSVEVQDGILSVEAEDERKWYEYIGIMIDKSKITIYLPEKEYKSLLIKESTGEIDIAEEFSFKSIDITASTGDIFVKNVKVGMIDLCVSTGKITVSDVICEGDVSISVTTGRNDISNTTCKNIRSAGSTGDIFMENVVVSEKISLERSTGDVRFEKCDAADIFIKTSTGDVTGSFMTEKVCTAESNTGRVDVPDTMVGGRCKIRTSTGNIKIY